MQWGQVIGHATSTLKHRSLNGWRLVIVQPVGPTGAAEADPVVAVDKFGSSVGQRVILNVDGRAAREYVNDEKSPVRHFVIGLVDDPAATRAISQVKPT